MVIRRAISAAAASTLLAAVALVAAPAAPALAYEKCKDIDATASVKPSSAPGGAKVTLTVKLTNCQKEGDDEDREGKAEKERERQQGDESPAANQKVDFSQESGPRKCHVTFSPLTGTTNAKGIVTAKVTLPRNCPGTYELLAKGAGFSAEATVREKGGFFPGDGQGENVSFKTKNQSFITTDSRQQSVPVLPLLLVGAGVALLAAGGAGFIRRPRSNFS